MPTKNITVPDIGGVTDVVVIEVLVKADDHIKIDTPLVTLESDKATMEVPSSDEGVVKEVKVKVGDKLSQGSIILLLETAGQAVVAEKAPPAEKVAPKQVETPAPAEPQTGTVITAGHNADVHAGPAVRKLAREFGVNLADVPRSGPKDRILKEDVQTYVKIRLSHNALRLI